MIEKSEYGVIFDMDGTLVSSQVPWYLSMKEVLVDYGIDFREEHSYEVMAHGELIGYLETKFGRKINDPKIFQTRLYQCYDRHLCDGILPMPGAIEAINRLYPYFPLGIGTSSASRHAEIITEQLNIRTRFKTIVGGDAVLRRKPAPDVFLAAADKLGLPPERCIMVEDSINGLESAKAAGGKCIVIPSSPEGDFSKADLLLTSLNQITRPLIESLLN